MQPYIYIYTYEISAWLFFLSLGVSLLAVGATILYYWKYREPGILPDIGIWLLLAMIFGSHTLFVLVEGQPYSEILRPLSPGFLSSGGIVTIAAVLILYARFYGIPLVRLFDTLAPFAPLAEATGHIGCLMAGCCFGAVSALPWAIQYPAESLPFQVQVVQGLIERSATASLAVHPLPLYNSILCLVSFAFLIAYSLKPRKPGTVTLLFIIFHGFIRFGAQFLRGNTADTLLGLRIPQWTSLLLALTALAVLLWQMNKKTKQPLKEEML